MSYRPKLNVDARLVDLMAKNPWAEAGRSIGAGLIALGERKNLRAKEAKADKEKEEKLKAIGALNEITNPELSQKMKEKGANPALVEFAQPQPKKVHNTIVNENGVLSGVYNDGSTFDTNIRPKNKELEQFGYNQALNAQNNDARAVLNAKKLQQEMLKQQKEHSFKHNENLINLGFKENENQKDRIHKKQESEKDRRLRLEQKAQDIKSRGQEKQKDRALRQALAPKKNSLIEFDAATPAQKAWAVNNNRWSRDKNGKRFINLNGFSSKQNSTNFGDLEL